MPAVRTTKTKAKAIKPHSKATTSSDDTAGSSTSSNDEQKVSTVGRCTAK